ncbi:MAG: tetratricopeptide repeat protein [Bdellovibrionota bacterium]
MIFFLGACTAGVVTKDALLGGRSLEPLRAPTFEDNQSLSSAALKLKLTHQFLVYQLLKMQGDETALPLLQKSALEDPASAQLQLLVSREAFRLGDLDAAEVSIHKAIALDPKNAEIRREFVNVLAAREKFSEAYVILDKLLQETPDDEELLNLAIGIDIKRDDYWIALKRLETALKTTEAPEFVYYRIGRVYRDMGKSKEAREAFEKSLQADPAYYQSSTYLAILCEEMGDEPRALELYERLAHYTNNALYHRKLASLYMKRKEYPKAIESFENLLQLEPGDMNGLLQMARAWIEVGDLPKSESKFRDLLKLDPENGTLRLMLGMLLEAQSRTEESLQNYVLIKSDSSAYYDSMGLRLKALQKLDRKDALLDGLKQAVVLAEKIDDASKSQALYHLVAQYYSQLEDFPKTESVLSAALKRFPTSEALLFQKGMLCEKMGHFDEGVKTMLSVLTINPLHVGALNYVGYTWADQGKNLEEAEKFVQKALSVEPGDPFITDSMGWVYYNQGRFQLAYETLWKAYQKVPQEFVIVEHLGDILVKLGRLSEARDYYAKALHLKPDHQDMLAKVQTKLQQIEAKLPPDSRVGSNENSCDGLLNRRCAVERLQHVEAGSRRSPASPSVDAPK